MNPMEVSTFVYLFILNHTSGRELVANKEFELAGGVPRGADSLKGIRKLDACLKLGPTVTISWMRSSMQMMPKLPSACAHNTSGVSAF